MIQSVQRAFELMEAIGAFPQGARLGDVADAAGLNRSTAHNLLATLQQLGYVGQASRGGVYTLTDRLSELARGAAVSDDDLRDRLHPSLESLAKATGETCYLAVPAGDQYVCLDAVESQTPLRLTVPIGGRDPLLGTAIGHTLLAARPDLAQRLAEREPQAWNDTAAARKQAQRDGYALDLAGFHADISCVAIPVSDRGIVRAAIGVAGPTSRLPASRLREIAQLALSNLPQQQDRAETGRHTPEVR